MRQQAAAETPAGQGADAQLGGRKADRAYRLLKREIVLRERPPETQLREQTLAQELGCSQGTVREALLKLVEDGLVERRGYRGSYVTHTSLEEVGEMVRIHLSIERRAARCIARLDASEVGEQLDLLLARIDDAMNSDDFFVRSELDRAYHAELVNLAGLGLLSPILLRCALHIHRYTLGNVEVPRQFSQEAGMGEEHRALLAEMTSGSPDDAERAIVTHLARVLDRWAPSVLDAVGPEPFALAQR